MPQTVPDMFAVQQVLLRYAASIDDRQMEMYRSCFCDDVELRGFGKETVHGADAWLEYVQTELEAYSETQHMLGPPLVSIRGDEASCRTDVQALHCLREPAGEVFTLWAIYFTKLVRVRGQWKIKRHDLVPCTARRERFS